MKTVIAVVLLLVAAFCLFGFLASFEPGAGHGWFKLLYAFVGLLCAVGAAVVFIKRSPPVE